MKTRPAVLGALMAILPFGVAAGQSNPPMIPTELAMSMMDGWAGIFGGKLLFSVGEPPARWPADLVPAPPAAIIGGFSMGPMQSMMIRLPREIDPVAVFNAMTTTPRWKPPQVPPTMQGFVPRVTLAVMKCTDSLQVTLNVVDSTATHRTLALGVVGYAEMRATGGCRQDQYQARTKMALVLPPLPPPRGVMATPGGTGGGGNSMEARVTLDATMGADSIALHYTNLLKAAGWTLVRTQLSSEGVAIRELSARDSEGVIWTGAIFVLSSADRREVAIRMLREL